MPQIRQILKKHFAIIIEYLRRERTANCLSDIDDGQLFQKSRAATENDELLTFTMNFDGATVFNSTHGSMWPVQFYLNFLPPALRYMPENIIVTTVFYGAKKPDVSKLVFPIVKELEANDHQMTRSFVSAAAFSFFRVICQPVLQLKILLVTMGNVDVRIVFMREYQSLIYLVNPKQYVLSTSPK